MLRDAERYRRALGSERSPRCWLATLSRWEGVGSVLRSGRRRSDVSDPLHLLAVAVEERILAELLLNRNRPSTTHGSWSLLGASDGENCRGCLGPAARSKQPEVPHC